MATGGSAVDGLAARELAPRAAGSAFAAAILSLERFCTVRRSQGPKAGANSTVEPM